MINTNYNELYRSYLEPPVVVCRWYGGAYSWIITGCATVGWLYAFRRRLATHDAALFLTAFGSLTLLLWVVVVRELGEHYTLHFTLFVVLGLLLFCLRIWLSRSSLRGLGLGAVLAVVLVNLIYGLTPLRIGNEAALSPLLGIKSAPLRRPDYDEVVRLVRYLRATAVTTDPIYVAASSDALNHGELSDAERTVYGWNNTTLTIQYVPIVDSRDFLPLEPLLQAQYVVIATPFQYHLAPQEQDLVRVVVDIFNNRWGLASDFEQLPIKFHLADGIEVSVYRRIQPTSLATALQTLRHIENYVPEPPGGQLDWMQVDGSGGVHIERHSGGTYRVEVLDIPSGMISTTLLYLGPHGQRMVVRGTLRVASDRCPSEMLKFVRVDMDGQGSLLTAIPLQHRISPFSVTLDLPARHRLLLVLPVGSVQAGRNICTFSLEQLQVEEQTK